MKVIKQLSISKTAGTIVLERQIRNFNRLSARFFVIPIEYSSFRQVLSLKFMKSSISKATHTGMIIYHARFSRSAEADGIGYLSSKNQKPIR